MKIKILIGLLLISLSSACGPSEKDLQNMLSQTLTALPQPVKESTPIQTQSPEIPLIDLITSKENYLPTGLVYGQYRTSAPENFDGIVQPIDQVDIRFSRNGEIGGGITVFIYDNKETTDSAFNYVYHGIIEEDELGIIGIKKINVGNIKAVHIAAQKCNVLYYVEVNNTDDVFAVKEYLKQIIGNINPYVCK
jgi:hypothetical protein